MDWVSQMLKEGFAQRTINRWKEVEVPVLEERLGKQYRYWQAGDGFDWNVRDMEELGREIRYLHDNPVERGLVARPADWRWSSARWYAGERVGVEIDEIQEWDRPEMW